MKLLNQISFGFKNLLYWLDEHQIGILTTIAVHLFFITVILILKVRTQTEREYSIMIDLSQIDISEEMPEETPQEQSMREFEQSLHQEHNIRNIPVNTANEKAVENIDKMVRDIKHEMNITDPEPKDTPEETPPPQDDQLLEREAQIYDDKFPTNAAGERTVYKGATTVSYELSGRRHTWMPAPVYKCQGKGRIVVNIVVSHKGYVLSAEINKSQSDSEDSCLTDAAKRDALRSRFNESSSAETKQRGTITYVFMPQ